MHAKISKAAAVTATAGAVMAGGLGTAQAAVTYPPAGTYVGCNSSTLVSDINGASSGAVLILAPVCTYTLESALSPIASTLTIRGSFKTVIQRDTAASAFSLFTVGSGGNLTLSGLTLRNGDADTGGDDDGGAIYNDGGKVSVSNVVFSSNYADDDGGAIYSDGTLRVSGSTFTGNTAPEYAGALYADGQTTASEDSFRNNGAVYGGAVYNADDLSGSSDTFTGNSASYGGGGIYNEDLLDLSNTTYSNNNGSQYGGAVFNNEDATLRGQHFIGNTSPEGGAIYNETDLTVSGSSFANNHGVQGGGLYNYGDASLTDDFFIGNYVSYEGGAIFAFSDGTDLSNSVIFGNYAPAGGGGGIDNYGGTVDLTHTTVSFNIGSNCVPIASVSGCVG